MSYTSYSPLVTNSPKWEAPLSEDTLMRGAIFAENNAQEAQKEIQGSIDNFFRIQAIAPQDEKVLRQRQAEFEQALSGVNISDLSNPNTKAQLNQIVSKFSNDPDILGIAQRSAAVQKEQALQREYELKGKSYVSPLLRQASKYIQGGNYYRDQKFNEQGFVAPDNKDISEWAKSTPEFEKWVKNGAYDDHLKGKAMSSLQSNILQGFKNTPQWQKLHTDNFEQLIDGQDLTSYLDAPSETVAQLFPHLPDSIRPQAEKYISDLQSLKGNPYAPSIMKNRLQELYLQDQAYQAAQAYAYTNTIDHRVNDLYKSATDFQEAKDLELYKRQLDAGLIDGIPAKQTKSLQGMNPVIKKFYEESIKRGVNVIDPNGNLIPPQDLPDLPEKKAAVDAASKDLGIKTVNNLVSKIKSGILNETDEKSLLTYVRNHRDKLGIDPSSTIKSATMDNGKVTVKIEGMFNKNKEYTPEEFESRVSDSGQKISNFDKSTLDSKTLKALEDNLKANPGASEEEVAKAMGLIQ